jgi:hypothetical protein
MMRLAKNQQSEGLKSPFSMPKKNPNFGTLKGSGY